QFCEHAKGKLEEIVIEAIKKKFLVYGLSEHCPRYRVQDLYPEESHLKPSDLSKTFSEFVIEARRLQEKYKSQITLLVGLESENITSSSTIEIKNLISQYNLDYLVGSVHHAHETPIDFDLQTFEIALSKSATSNNLFESNVNSLEENLFASYFDAQYQLLKDLKPMVVGHFDVIRIFRPNFELTDFLFKKIERNIEFVVEYGGLFEINSAGFKKLQCAYPQKDILKLIIEKGGKLTISDDCHSPQSVGMNYHKLYDYLKEFSINELYYLDIDLEKPKQDRKVVVKVMTNVLDHEFWNGEF
ncbi:5262_t:CDS:2, partial [Cetraspora pellucida]